MRPVTILLLALTLAVAMTTHYCECARLRGLSLTEEDDEFQPRRFYREFGLIRKRPSRAYDEFDDYGHLRFGRSDN
ncbi:sulfakinin precursor [Danaus plexippus plexippus]|uniref:Sulfakinin n=1 Tax=Danaus plexippus plexippus TaxID=278856 RepID=A0A212ESX3_DANPL|nr:sulfakinin precursor [Danaus plexippus plexippus]